MGKDEKKSIFLIVTIFSLLICFNISSQAATKIKISGKNFSQQMKYYAEREDANQDGYLSAQETSEITQIHLESNENTDIFRGIRYFTNLKELWFESYIDRRNPEDITEPERSNIQKMDLSGLNKLQKLEIECGNSYLQQINLKGCTNLKEIYIQGDGKISDHKKMPCAQKVRCKRTQYGKAGIKRY